MQSYHNFLFPFRLDRILEPFENKHDYYKQKTFDDRIAIDDAFKELLEKDGWRYERFVVNNHLDYNELVYFYDFVKDSLFNTQDFKKNATSYYFTKELSADASYIIKVQDKDPYKLQLSSITLRIFDTGVGILSFEVQNAHYSELEDIFNINEYGRRVYPQFLGAGFDVDAPKEQFLAEYLEVNGTKEEFDAPYRDVKLSPIILETLGETFSDAKKERGKYFIQPLLDDRMFVLSHIMNDNFSHAIKEDYVTDSWYEYIFLDKYKAKNIQNLDMQKSLVKKTSYTRWQGYGTLYGITRYSFVLLSDASDFSKDVLQKHMQTLYFQMLTLSLATRASILRFSDEITAISDIDANNKEISSKIANLYKNYLRFKNKLYFKEITPQEQGIELYDKIRENMRIDSDIADLSQEITALNNYASVLQEQDEKEEMAKLTKLGAYLLPPSLIVGFFGMNVFGEKSFFSIENGESMFLAFILIPLSIFITKELLTKRK